MGFDGYAPDFDAAATAGDGPSIPMQVEEQGENNVDITKNNESSSSSSIALLVDMGFEPHRASEALAACFGSIDE